MELPLEELENATLDGWTFQVKVERAEARPWPFHLTTRGPEGAAHPLFRGTTNPGTRWRHPWLEARYTPPFQDDELEERFFAQVLPRALLPGSYMMISCDGHPETLTALTVAVPPPATRLGYLLYLAGARWYKVWYYPEGWREGHEKLQGNLPTGDEHRETREAERAAELRTFLDSDQANDHPACAERARRILEGT